VTPSPTPPADATKDDATKPDATKPDASGKDDAPKVDAPKVDAPKLDAPKDEAPKDAPKAAAAASLSDEEVAEIKKLPAAEQTVALKQIICPASGENLGSMGKPVKVTAKGKTFFLCCSSCEKDVKADPDAVLAKLNK